MMFTANEVLFVSVFYLLLIFVVAYYFERHRRGLLSEYLSPFIYALSLAVYCTSWTFYGSVGRAATSGISFLAIYIGPTLISILFPVFLTKVIRIARNNGITSLSDLLGLRYGRSLWMSRLVTLVTLIGITPYIGLQIKAIIATFGIISTKDGSEFYSNWAGLLITIILCVFTVVFGARKVDPSERHTGLVYAIAFESVIKLAAFFAVGLFVVYYFFGGIDHIFKGIEDAGLSELLRIGGDTNTSYSEWFVLVVLSMFAVVLLPRQFQMAVVENTSLMHIKKTIWLFPLYLLLINLFVVPIAFAGLLKGMEASTADYFVLTIPLSEGFKGLGLVAYIGGFSAATAMIIVEAVALSTMVVNSFIIPVVVRKMSDSPYLSKLILQIKRAVIVGIIFLGYLFALTFGEFFSLVDLGLKSFEAVSLLAPAFFLGLYWKRANKIGAMAGLIAGFVIWFYTLILPAFMKAGLLGHYSFLEQIATSTLLNPSSLFGLQGLGKWEHSLFWSMSTNLLLFVGLSILCKQTEEEQIQAIVFVDSYEKGYGKRPIYSQSWQSSFNLSDIENTLSHYIGASEAEKALKGFIQRHRLDPDRLTSTELFRVRQEAEKLLSASIGPVLASLILDKRLLMTEEQRQLFHQEVRQMSEGLRLSRQELAEKNRELLSLKEFTEKIIESAPIGIATVDKHLTINYWNTSMQIITGIVSDKAKSKDILSVLPWLKPEWFDGSITSSGSVRLPEAKTLQYSINPLQAPLDGYVLILEDVTERKKMEEELLHSAKLASIGRLTAGLSHEIGNPLASIYSLTQELMALDMSHPKDREFTKEALNTMSSHINRISTIVQNLGRFSRVANTEKRPSDLTELFEKTLALVRFDSRFKGVNIKTEIAPTPLVNVNPDQIQQLFMNLLINAIDAMPEGGDIVAEIFAQEDQVVFKLSDTGIGIDEADINKIYDPFFTTKPPSKGTGLGLSICYGIVKNHGGSISVTSVKGQGSCFTVKLPMKG